MPAAAAAGPAEGRPAVASSGAYEGAAADVSAGGAAEGPAQRFVSLPPVATQE